MTVRPRVIRLFAILLGIMGLCGLVTARSVGSGFLGSLWSLGSVLYLVSGMLLLTVQDWARKFVIVITVALAVLSALPTIYTVVAWLGYVLAPNTYGTGLKAMAYAGAYVFFMGVPSLALLAWHVALVFVFTRPRVKAHFRPTSDQ